MLGWLAAPFQRLGLRGRLRAAFLALSALVVLAAVVSMVSFFGVDRALSAITDDNVPLVIASVDLSRQAERIVAAAPALLNAPSAKQQTIRSAALNDDVDRLHAALQQLSPLAVEASAVDSIRRAVEQVRETIGAIDRVVSARLAVRAQQQAQLDDAQATLGMLVQLLETQARALGSLPSKSGTASHPALHGERNEAALLLARLQAAAVAADAETASALEQRALESLQALERALPLLAQQLQPSFAAQLQRARSFVDGGASVSRLRVVELQMLTAGAMALEENAALSQRFAAAVDRLVASAKARIVSASAEARAGQTRTVWILLTVVALTLVSSFLIGWLYVQRNVIARLTGLADSMRSIAGGELDAPLPSVGHDEIGQMAQALAVFRDTAVEVRRSNLAEIQVARRRLDDAIESIQEGFALFDSADRLLLCNSHYGELLYDHIDVPAVGETYENILRRALERGLIRGVGGDPQAWLQTRLDLHRRGEGMHQQQRASGRWLRITEHKTVDGGTVAVYADITELKGHEQELGDMVHKLRAANEAKSAFVANVSHELRTPLAAILGFTRIVQKRLEAVVFPQLGSQPPREQRAIDQVRENLGIVLLEGERLTKLVNQVLDLEKIEAGEMVLDIRPLALQDVLQQARAATDSLHRAKGLDFVVDLQADLPQVLGDRDRVMQVLVNLISNAVKFTEVGTVSCSAARDGSDAVLVSVADTGRGIALEDQATVFEKFRQVGDTLTDKPSGTGLGLPICREIVTRLGGRISVRSVPGQGSIFAFSLPVAPPEATLD